MTTHQRNTLIVCCVGFFMVLLDLTIVNTALPTIEVRLHAGFNGVQWVVDCYSLAFAALLLTGGTFADRFGRKRSVYGVRTVADETTVELPEANVVGDEEIAETIARQLHWNTVVPDTVKAEVRNGFVTLRGTVEWSYQRDEAERPPNHVRGVYLVTNLITVEPRSELAVADLEQRVHEAIGRMADLDARSIGVSASDGTVHLQGSVHSLADRRIAEHVAASAPGVKEVKNDIVVTP